MAGSLKWFVYTDDAGTDWAIFRDESNTENVNAGTQDFPNNGTIINAVPKNLQPRYVRFRNAEGTVARNIVALTVTIYNALAAGSTITDQVSGETLLLTEKVGERRRIPIGPDTGLTDGDAT